MKTLFKNFYLLNGRNDMAITHIDYMLVENERIKGFYSSLVEADKTIDLKDSYVIPGLINLHAHLIGSGKPTKGETQKKIVSTARKLGILDSVGYLISKGTAKQALLSGTTTVRSVGGLSHIDTKLRNNINAGKEIGPRLIVCDYALAAPKGHMTGTVSKEIFSIEEAKDAILDLVKHNVDAIKLMVTGGVLDASADGEPGALKIDKDLAKFIVSYAHKNNKKVIAHVEGREGIHLAIEIGIDSIEHGSIMLDEDIQKLKENKGRITLTFSPTIPYQEYIEGFDYKNDLAYRNTELVRKNMIKCGEACLANDIEIGLGTDAGCPYTTHYNSYHEIILYAKYLNRPLVEGLYHMTLGNAKFLGLDKDIGSIEEGKIADLVVLKESPLDNPLTMGKPLMVIKEGKIFNKPRIKHYKKVDELLNKFYKEMMR